MLRGVEPSYEAGVLSVALSTAEQLHRQVVVLLEVDCLVVVTVVDVEAFDGCGHGDGVPLVRAL
jgi:hypothetical protein